VGGTPGHLLLAAYGSTGLRILSFRDVPPSLTSTVSIRHARPKLYCTLVLGRGRGQRRRLSRDQVAPVSRRYRIAAHSWSRESESRQPRPSRPATCRHRPLTTGSAAPPSFSSSFGSQTANSSASLSAKRRRATNRRNRSPRPPFPASAPSIQPEVQRARATCSTMSGWKVRPIANASVAKLRFAAAI
jgi:hypothetical protein